MTILDNGTAPAVMLHIYNGTSNAELVL